jgi:hypothetical protein
MYYNKKMFLGLNQVYYRRFVDRLTNIKIKLEIIYKSTEDTNERELGFA